MYRKTGWQKEHWGKWIGLGKWERRVRAATIVEKEEKRRSSSRWGQLARRALAGVANFVEKPGGRLGGGAKGCWGGV